MGHQRILPGLQRHGHSEAARLAAQRKIYCIWFVAVVVPFAVLFCLFPSSYRASKANLLPVSAPKPRISADNIAHRRQVSVQASIATPGGHNKSRENLSRKSGDKLADGKSKPKIAKRETVEDNATAKSSVNFHNRVEETSGAGNGRSAKDRDSPSGNSKKRSNKNDQKSAAAGRKRIEDETTDELRLDDGGSKSRGTQQIRKRHSSDLLQFPETEDADTESDLPAVAESSRSAGSRKKKGSTPDFSQVRGRAERDDELILPAVGSFAIRKTSDPLEAPEAKRKGEPGSTIIHEKKEKVQCDLSKGRWIPDKKGPLYTNATCPWIDDDQNCMQKSGSDGNSVYRRWKPDGCELDRFNGKAFLKAMKRKSLAFVGDSIARIQMQSLLCLLAQVESPKPIYVDKENQSSSWHFTSSNFTVSAVWSPYLVEETGDEIKGAPEGVKKLRVDVLDPKWARMLPRVDAVVVSGAGWFQGPAVYVVRNEAKGCYGCGSKEVKEMGFYSGYRAAIRSTLLGVRLLPGFQGWTVLHSTDLSCSRSDPAVDPAVSRRKQQEWSRKMAEIRRDELDKARKRGISNGSGLALLETSSESDNLVTGSDIPAFVSGNSDRSQAVSGKTPDRNCDCLPGPSDSWNQILLQILLRRP